MHKMVGVVFKVLMLSTIILMLFNLAFIVFDTTTVRSRVESLSLVMQDELTRNNSMPSDMVDLFNKQLTTIMDRSNIVTGLQTNMTAPITVDGVTYPSLDKAREYGDLMTLVIKVDLEPHGLQYVKNKSDVGSGGNGALKWASYNYTSVFKYEVPALRVLK